MNAVQAGVMGGSRHVNFVLPDTVTTPMNPARP
jgi:hypothetical protein